MVKEDKSKDPNRKKIEDYDAVQIYNVGYSFLLAAERCNKPEITEQGWTQQLILPVVVNTAFSCELFIKALLQKHGLLEERAGHKLYDLFFCLPEEIRNMVTLATESEKINTELSLVSNVFQDWRYIYETELISINIEFLISFTRKMKDVAMAELGVNP